MSTKDRKSNVPLGAFGASEPPPPPDATLSGSRRVTSDDVPELVERPSVKRTLVGHPVAPAGSLTPATPPPATGSVVPDPARRSSVPNTLVGHPRASDPGSAPAGPFLAPPKWRGAEAYEGDAPPELEVGRGSRPAVEPEELERPTPEAEASAAPALDSDPPPAGSANLDASIQRMLDKQTAVSMEVEELSASDIEVSEAVAAAKKGLPAPPASDEVKAERAAPQDEVVSIPSGPGVPLAPTTSLAPAEVPTDPPDDANAGLGVLMVAAVFVIGVGGWLLTQGTYQRTAMPAAAPAPAPAAPKAAAPVAPGPPPAPAVEAPPAPAAAPEAASEAAKPTEGNAAPAPAPRPVERAKPRPARKKKRVARAKEEAPEPAPAPVEAPRLAPVEAYPAQGAPAPAAKALPDLPSRDDVMTALSPIRAEVAACAGGIRGVAEVDITVQNTGQVSHAVVGGDFAGTAEGSCIARAVRRARFAPFKEPRFRVVYPFAL